MNDINKSREAADSYAELAERLYREGLLKEAEFGFEAAASIDLSDVELQNCWGGAFNGQIARCNLVQEIIQTWKPDAIIETGTFRGVTAEWFAEITSVPIYTCEKNKRFFLQSRQRLAKWSNVHILLQDSREFILQIAGDDVSTKKVLFYLDAHWEQDLPLREEINLIFKHFENPCVIVDDFRVPFDSGYFYDDYGPGKVLSLEILDGLLTPDILIAFPSTPSELDSGARRGAVILTLRESSEIIASTNLVRVAGPHDWQITEFKSVIDKQTLKINELIKKINELQYHADERMRQINELTDIIKKNTFTDEQILQKDILTNRINELQYHADERMRQINELTDIIKKKNIFRHF